jgi:hypothetical protein
MAQATVKTVQYLDPRIEPQPDPVYDYVIGPTQNQYYQIPASGLSDSSITFNNLTTLGVDRAYLDTFEIELTATISFKLSADPFVANKTDLNDANDPTKWKECCPALGDWVFDSFPFNKCCDEARVNINGGAFFSQPMCYIRAKERYMNQEKLRSCYESVCPVQRPTTQTESGRNYNRSFTDTNHHAGFSEHMVPSRLGRYTFARGQQGTGEALFGGFNNDIIQAGREITVGDQIKGYENYYYADLVNVPAQQSAATNLFIVKVKWREPIFVSPFSSRYDATYGRPLYNITSMDLSFTMQNLGNMIRYANFVQVPGAGDPAPARVDSYTVHIDSAKLCYQVMTIPPILNKPLTTLVPYRRFVPYITDYNQMAPETSNLNVDVNGAELSITSGVYTFNEVPTAIWVFLAPSKDIIQTNKVCSFEEASPTQGTVTAYPSWDSNKLFAYIKSINISMANTTQILATAKTYDLYRIAKANGCEDSYWSWAGDETLAPCGIWASRPVENGEADAAKRWTLAPSILPYGAGSVLRLKPGVDLIVPDQPLIPGANANNMVFQCSAKFYVPPHAKELSKYSLWLLFEYVGVAAISPGQCEITMNPLGSGEIMAVSPVMSATSEGSEGQLEGSGFWDGVKRATGIAGQLADDGIISMILKRIPGAKPVADWASKHGLGEPCSKRTRGGAVMGKGLNDWI